MDKFQEKLSHLLSSVDGSCESFFASNDGILITHQTVNKSNLDIELLCANFVSIIKKIKESGNLKEIIISIDKNIIIMQPLDSGFLCLIISMYGNLGRAKIEISKIPKNFLE